MRWHAAPDVWLRLRLEAAGASFANEADAPAPVLWREVDLAAALAQIASGEVGARRAAGFASDVLDLWRCRLPVPS